MKNNNDDGTVSKFLSVALPAILWTLALLLSLRAIRDAPMIYLFQSQTMTEWIGLADYSQGYLISWVIIGFPTDVLFALVFLYLAYKMTVAH